MLFSLVILILLILYVYYRKGDEIKNCQLFFYIFVLFPQVSHPNIVSLVEEFHTSQHLYLVMELVRVSTFLRLISCIMNNNAAFLEILFKKRKMFIDLLSLFIRVATCLMPLPVLPAIQSRMQAL